jgi:hypothetical protein
MLTLIRLLIRKRSANLHNLARTTVMYVALRFNNLALDVCLHKAQEVYDIRLVCVQLRLALHSSIESRTGRVSDMHSVYLVVRSA